jgi:hypothetical protein
MKPDDRSLSSVDRAVQRYSATLRQGTNPCRADGDADGQAENFRDALQRADLRYSQVKEILYSAGILTTQFIYYHNFTLHLDKLFRRHSSETLHYLAQQALSQWTCYGCSSAVLREICSTVFALALADETGDTHRLDNPARQS